ncbi:MAG TPA: tRNA (N(6)-L-threonylcarbamoyladenosine(37)-C(2))-methylthiotransferase MtaB [Candidatus Kapabacteria bacterium]|nr:tRNA (N(6)-L-threonylcarbamoyladenosine(37)-C(2))-methylthiotransferase MtaB [Candidatus Kapabacteria bacterium]
MPNVAFHTLGCKLNYAETSALSQQFVDRGFNVVETEGADVFVLNTCTVTENADREARQIVRRALRNAPDAVVIVTGCYAQLQPEEIASIEGVDLVLGAAEKLRMFDFLSLPLQKNNVPHIACAPIEEAEEFGAAFSAEGDSRTRAFLKVQDGCDFNCSFCTIPLARGASRSQSIAATVEQASLLAIRGYKEIILTGVNVGDYGKKDGTDLLTLLRALETVNGIERIRISSIEPNLFTHELLDYVAQSAKVCPHFHIPLQSGSDEILRQMRRRYDSTLYAELIARIIEKIPDAGIGVDVITGFPGETEDHFLETYSFLRDLPIAYLHVFTYSERENTPAAAMAKPVATAERKRRNEMLRTLSAKKRLAFNTRSIGETRKVLFEHEPKNGLAEGYTDNYVRVAAPFEPRLKNAIADVRLASVNEDGCMGEIVAVHEQQRATLQIL